MSNERSDHTPAPTGPADAKSRGLPRRHRAPKSTPSSPCQIARPGGRGRQARPAHFRARRHHEPAADLGSGVRAPGRYVSEAAAVGGLDIQLVYYRGLGGMPRLALDGGAGAVRRADVAHRLPRRPYPDRKSSRPRPPRETTRPRSARWCSSAMPWRKRSMTCAPVPASLACATCRRSCSRKATIRSASRRSARLSG